MTDRLPPNQEAALLVLAAWIVVPVVLVVIGALVAWWLWRLIVRTRWRGDGEDDRRGP